MPIVAYTIGGETIDDRDGAWAATYGVDDAGAVLVRPDGHVAWRRPAAGPAHALADG